MLGGGESRALDLPEDASERAQVIDMEQIDPDAVELPAWYRPNPGLARDLAFIAFNAAGGELVAKQITNYRWAVSAFGTASTAALDRSDTVYCLTPLHHESALLVSLGGAVVGGTRIALSRGLHPDRFVHEIRQYGVTVVSYTWAMLREVVDDPAFVLQGNHPVRLFIGSGMPTGLWDRVCDAFTPAHVVEFFATTDGQAVLANVSGVKVGSEGRPLPGAGRVELGAYDAENDLILENERGFVQLADVNQVGVLLAQSRGPIDPTASVKRGVFSAGDTWISTEYLFRRDDDGDYWLMGRRGSMILTARGMCLSRGGYGCVRLHRRCRPGGDLRRAGRRSGGCGVGGDVAAGSLDHGRGLDRGRRQNARGTGARYRACGAGDGAERELPSHRQRSARGGHSQAGPAASGLVF